MASEKREVCERQVVDTFQNAGVVDPSLHTRLKYVDQAKCQSALSALAQRYGLSLSRDYQTLADVAGDICTTKRLC
ncbi:hypothetical protein [Pseudomonas sp. NPDC089401]|uniref:hypothetical protein n=1 Tax=Pseudomonas sp. NPDC089401 TaxID=3364462 RepID=UPI0038008001